MHANATAHVATSMSANSKQCVDNLDVATSGDLQTHVVSSGFQEVEKMSVYYEICHSFFFSLSRACRLCIVEITIMTCSHHSLIVPANSTAWCSPTLSCALHGSLIQSIPTPRTADIVIITGILQCTTKCRASFRGARSLQLPP